MIEPHKKPAHVSPPNKKPTIIGLVITKAPGAIMLYNAPSVAISIHLV